METKLIAFEQKVNELVDKRIQQEIEEVQDAIEKTFLRRLKNGNKDIFWNIDFFDEFIESCENYQEILQKHKEKVSKEIVNELLSEKKEIPTKQISEKPKSNAIIDIEEKIASMQTKINFLNDFLSKIYKGSDAKQKIEKELIVFNQKLYAYRECLSIVKNYENKQ